MHLKNIVSIFLLSFACLSSAQTSKTTTIIVPFATGGTVDIVARQLAPDLGKSLGDNIIVDNKGGAGGTIATAKLATSSPDGKTIMFHHMGFVFNPALYDKLPFDTRKDIIPVADIGVTPNVLVVTNSLPAKNITEFLAYARKNPGKINYGSGGVGSAGHLAMEMFEDAGNFQATHVPYKGSGPAITDLISGQIQAMLMTIASIKPYIDSGQVRALATSGLARTPSLPTLPTLNESGLKGFSFEPWYGVFAPAKTPQKTLEQINTAVNDALKNPENQVKLAGQGLEVKPMTIPQFTAMVDADLAKWDKVIKRLNIKAE
ncbi:tripartite tricarboxylate transporter substrate binding protein [Polynucleobacter sp. UK-Mo-2m-Kol15]|uniref:Bug family tripartite tricarboxylate transporter substrate binding protein n=1 Tax=Polynucleobacter sp. UK-Mo-2m-Kol15 TaxID=2576916 RepID=UPI001C0D3B11|nr:tripartite tricarboxylate transporter substrate binding protein [Polynucleobacter sp. UK-Mo-2m-Kol15]MBU3575000.1 tripartite tricarboxylate transporter substrate binding protein [Polynucleobacter sp. UK-Mo-2m-Kol15]